MKTQMPVAALLAIGALLFGGCSNLRVTRFGEPGHPCCPDQLVLLRMTLADPDAGPGTTPPPPPRHFARTPY